MADITFNVGGTDRQYIAQNVSVRAEWLGKRPRLADRTNLEFTDGYHLVFEVSGEDIEQVSGTAKDIRTLQTDIEDENTTVTAKVKTTAWEVVGRRNQNPVYTLEFGTRRDSDLIQCITKNKLSKADMTEFEKV